MPVHCSDCTPLEALASPEAAWEWQGSTTWKCMGFWPVTNRKRQGAAEELPVFLLFAPRQSGSEIHPLWCIPDQVTTFVLCWAMASLVIHHFVLLPHLSCLNSFFSSLLLPWNCMVNHTPFPMLLAYKLLIHGLLSRKRRLRQCPLCINNTNNEKIDVFSIACVWHCLICILISRKFLGKCKFSIFWS